MRYSLRSSSRKRRLRLSASCWAASTSDTWRSTAPKLVNPLVDELRLFGVQPIASCRVLMGPELAGSAICCRSDDLGHGWNFLLEGGMNLAQSNVAIGLVMQR